MVFAAIILPWLGGDEEPAVEPDSHDIATDTSGHVTKPPANPRLTSQAHQSFFSLLMQVRSHWQNRSYHDVIRFADVALAYPQQPEEKQTLRSQLIELIELKAKAQRELWFLVEAVVTVEKGLQEFDSRRLRRLLEKVNYRLEQSNSERHLTDKAELSRNVGSAKKLLGRILVVYVYIDDGKGSHWSNLDRQFTESQLSRAKHWYQQTASRYGHAQPEFVLRSFLFKRDPVLKRHIHYTDQHQEALIVERLAQRAGFSSIEKWQAAMQKEAGADSIMLYLHFNTEARSYASRCFIDYVGHFDTNKVHCAEYSFIFEKARNNRQWHKIPIILAHEGLHLFGADDLYSIKQARRYTPRGIMNYYTRYLDDAEVSELTAYSVGWRNTAPDNVPFPIVERGEKP